MDEESRTSLDGVAEGGNMIVGGITTGAGAIGKGCADREVIGKGLTDTTSAIGKGLTDTSTAVEKGLGHLFRHLWTL